MLKKIRGPLPESVNRKKWMDGAKEYLNDSCLKSKAQLMEYLNSQLRYKDLIPVSGGCLRINPTDRWQFCEISQNLWSNISVARVFFFGFSYFFQCQKAESQAKDRKILELETKVRKYKLERLKPNPNLEGATTSSEIPKNSGNPSMSEIKKTPIMSDALLASQFVEISFFSENRNFFSSSYWAMFFGILFLLINARLFRVLPYPNRIVSDLVTPPEIIFYWDSLLLGVFFGLLHCMC
jgi:hypothetical protein